MSRLGVLFSLLTIATVVAFDASNIETEIEILGIKYRAECDCSGKDVDINGGSCNPSKIKLQRDREGSGTDINGIKDLIGPPADLTFAPIKETSFHCTDGRENGSVLSTLGGDAGEFLLGIIVYDDIR